MKIFQTRKIKEIDSKTIENEPISSIELMNRAALRLFEKIQPKLQNTDKILVVAGQGNNGGDAVAVARHLLESGYHAEVILCHPDAKVSRDTLEQIVHLQQTEGVIIHNIDHADQLKQLHTDWDCIIDGLFGSGLNRPLTGFFSKIVQWINQQNAYTISIDMPSGLYGEDNTNNAGNSIVQSDFTIGLQFPKLSYLLPENEPYIKQWDIVDIQLDEKVMDKMATPWYFTTPKDICDDLQQRSNFAHKGTFGKVLIAAGSTEMTGAAILTAKAALRAGSGLVFVHLPTKIASIIQCAIPEVIVLFKKTEDMDVATYGAIAIGPGIGETNEQIKFLELVLTKQFHPLVLDADALNWLSKKSERISRIPANSIITPHPKEFDRLMGKTFKNGYQRLEAAIEFAKKQSIYIVLKGAYSACISPQGTCSFNSTGNPGMATAGSGDVLTGIVVSLLAQGYATEIAMKLGVFLHGLSGDLALKTQSQESLIAGDIITHLGEAFNLLKKNK